MKTKRTIIRIDIDTGAKEEVLSTNEVTTEEHLAALYRLNKDAYTYRCIYLDPTHRNTE